jgi:hypothetical protein
MLQTNPAPLRLAPCAGKPMRVGVLNVVQVSLHGGGDKRGFEWCNKYSTYPREDLGAEGSF